MCDILAVNIVETFDYFEKYIGCDPLSEMPVGICSNLVKELFPFKILRDYVKAVFVLEILIDLQDVWMI